MTITIGLAALLLLSVLLNAVFYHKNRKAGLIAQQKFQAVLDSVPMVCGIFDKDGNTISVNQEVERFFNIPDKQIYIDNFEDFLPKFQPDGSPSFQKSCEMIKKAHDEGSARYEWLYQQRDGKPIPTEEISRRVDFGDQTVVICYSRDLREEYKHKEMERIARERMQVILDSSPLVCTVFDENGNLLEVNREVEHMFGLSDRQIFLDHYHEFFPEYQPDGTLTSDGEAKAVETAHEKGYYRREVMYQTQGGVPVPTEEVIQKVIFDGKVHFIIYVRDLREFYKNKEKDMLMQQNIQTKAEHLNGYVERQAAAVSQSSAAIEEMIFSVQSVTTTLSKNSANVKQLKEVSETGRTGLNEVAADIQEIARESESLLEINSVMQNIASQTNLLSMNAAIEAAHAGEVGKGFAVVADEIRKLAESSGTQSKTISAVLKKIKGSIDKITRSTGNVLNKFESIDRGVKTVVDQEASILIAMEEQGRGSQQVLQGIAEVNDITQQVEKTSHQLLTDSKKS